MKVGIGYDTHRLIQGRKLFLGGMNIPYSKGLLGHSDGDALLHSICDAIIGALGKGDIGKHFPDTDEKFKDISSIKLLKQVGEMLRKERKKIINIDSTIIIEEPELSSFFDNMKKIIGQTLHLKSEGINIKATTNEKMGFIGRSEGIAAISVVLID